MRSLIGWRNHWLSAETTHHYPHYFKRAITRLNCKQPTWNFGKALQLSNQLCLETVDVLGQNVLTLEWEKWKRWSGVPHPLLVMKFYEIFEKSKFDLYLYSLKIFEEFWCDIRQVLKGCVWAVTFGPPCTLRLFIFVAHKSTTKWYESNKLKARLIIVIATTFANFRVKWDDLIPLL